MNVKIRDLLLASLGILASIANAKEGGDKGHGGHAVVCPKFIQMLDTYEGHRRGLDSNLDSRASARQAFSTLVGRLAPFLPGLAHDLAQEAEPLLRDIESYPSLPVRVLPNGVKVRVGTAIFWSDDPEEFIPDTGVGFTPGKGCTLAQLIRNQTVSVPEDREYMIYNPYWERMPGSEQAVGVLHELLFKRSRAFGQTTSFVARYLNQHLLSDAFAGVGVCEYARDFHARTFSKITKETDASYRCDGQGGFAASDRGFSLTWSDSNQWTFTLTQSSADGNDRFRARLNLPSGGVTWTKFGSLACVNKQATITLYQSRPQDVSGQGRFASRLEMRTFEIAADRIVHEVECRNLKEGGWVLVREQTVSRLPVRGTYDFASGVLRFDDGASVGLKNMGHDPLVPFLQEK